MIYAFLDLMSISARLSPYLLSDFPSLSDLRSPGLLHFPVVDAITLLSCSCSIAAHDPLHASSRYTFSYSSYSVLLYTLMFIRSIQ